MAALHFILDSFWNTLAVILALAFFRPIRVKTCCRKDDE
jgi:hypothetical protein